MFTFMRLAFRHSTLSNLSILYPQLIFFTFLDRDIVTKLVYSTIMKCILRIALNSLGLQVVRGFANSVSESCSFLHRFKSDALMTKYRPYLAELLSKSKNLTQMKEQIDNLYIPLYSYTLEQMTIQRQINETSDSRPYVVGISAPQGCGKTTLTTYLQELFKADGMNCVSMSIDDFYLTYSEQRALADAYQTNKLLRYRGQGSFCVKSNDFFFSF